MKIGRFSGKKTEAQYSLFSQTLVLISTLNTTSNQSSRTTKLNRVTSGDTFSVYVLFSFSDIDADPGFEDHLEPIVQNHNLLDIPEDLFVVGQRFFATRS